MLLLPAMGGERRGVAGEPPPAAWQRYLASPGARPGQRGRKWPDLLLRNVCLADIRTQTGYGAAGGRAVSPRRGQEREGPAVGAGADS